VATLLSLFIVPILYIVVKNIEERMKTGLYRPKLDHELDVAIALTGDHLNGNHDHSYAEEDPMEDPKPH
jgi:HAE1 family hydrophobic/amphiphilic exporter-1